MRKFERPPLHDIEQLVQRLRGKSVDQIIVMLGQPARVLGPESNERHYCDGRSEVIEFLRTLEFIGVESTIHRFIVFERNDGKLEFGFHGKELESDATKG